MVKKLFVDMEEDVHSNVKFSDSSKVPMKRRGKIMFKSKNGEQEYISNVYYIPELKSNILSIGQLLEKGHTIQMEDSTLTLKDKNKKVIAKVHMSKNQIFSINIKTEIKRCYQAYLKEESRLWHLRYGHLNYESLKLLSSKEMVNGLPVIKYPKEVCEDCVIGKQTKIFFS